MSACAILSQVGHVECARSSRRHRDQGAECFVRNAPQAGPYREEAVRLLSQAGMIYGFRSGSNSSMIVNSLQSRLFKVGCRGSGFKRLRDEPDA